MPASSSTDQASSTREVVSGPRIEAREYTARRRALAHALEAKGAGGFIAYGDDRRFGGPNHIRYLTGFDPHFEPVFLAVRDEQLFLLSGSETLGLATNEQLVHDAIEVLAIRELAYPGLEYTSIELVPGVEFLRELFAGLETVALIGGSTIGVEDAATIIDPLRTSFRSQGMDAIAYGLRALKTEAENRVIDHAYTIAASGMRAAMDALRDGVRERDVAAEAEHAMRRAGADNFAFDSIVGSGPNSKTILNRSSDRAIAAGEPVAITLAPRYQGYTVSFGRPFVLGEASDAAFTRAVDSGWRAFEAAASELEPGRAGADATRAARSVVHAASLGTKIDDVWVHSMGVVEFEPPFFGPGSTAILEPGMALSIDVPLFHAPWGGLRIEDGYEITTTGARERIDGSHEAFPCTL